MRLVRQLSMAVIVAVSLAGVAQAGSGTSAQGAKVTWGFSVNESQFAANVEFTIDNGLLIVILTNNSQQPITTWKEYLSGVFFDINDFDRNLTPISAMMTDGSVMLFQDASYIPADNRDVGGHWAFGDFREQGVDPDKKKNYTAVLNSAQFGIAAYNYPGNIFGDDVFSKAFWTGGNGKSRLTNLDGALVGPGGTTITNMPAVKNSMTFTFRLPDEYVLDDVDIISSIGNVWFVFGKAFDSDGMLFRGERLPDEVPEPATMSLLALGGLALLRRRKA